MTDLSRNAPCRCGSGLKYKKCCLPKDDAQRKPHTGEDALLILQPTRGTICYETLLSLDQNTGVANRRLLRIARKPVDEARNLLARYALEAIADGHLFDFTPRETFILWLDDDAWLPPGLVPSMMRCLAEPAHHSIDALFGWFCIRQPYASPAAWRDVADAQSYPKMGVDCHFGALVDIQCAGFHCVLMRPRLLERIGPDPFAILPGYSEDFAFCKRARDAGARLMVGTGFPVPHVDPRDGTTYMVGQPAGIIIGNEVRAFSVEHLGASGTLKAPEQRQYGIDGGDAFAASAQAAAEVQAEMRKRQAILTTREVRTYGLDIAEAAHATREAAELDALIKDLEQRRAAAEGAA